jgi:hypothetical protein
MLRRRRTSLQPAVLPSLDRLSGLIDRVVELVDQVGDTTGPDPVPAAPAETPVAVEPESGWLAFVSTPQGYRLVDGPGAAPSIGDTVELAGGVFRVDKVGPSPLPGDTRRCAYLAGEEPPEAGRTSDA